jgi:hypothetical protein
MQKPDNSMHIIALVHWLNAIKPKKNLSLHYKFGRKKCIILLLRQFIS